MASVRDEIAQSLRSTLDDAVTDDAVTARGTMDLRLALELWQRLPDELSTEDLVALYSHLFVRGMDEQGSPAPLPQRLQDVLAVAVESLARPASVDDLAEPARRFLLGEPVAKIVCLGGRRPHKRRVLGLVHRVRMWSVWGEDGGPAVVIGTPPSSVRRVTREGRPAVLELHCPTCGRSPRRRELDLIEWSRRVGTGALDIGELD